ncbi:MAG: polysaccharide biosynthesis/export family protein [Mucilaginibacter sp.]|uniref:polysaccharide biosynthesis/export family protein n=1 Tax=Mucilaginibacter sp. TaxID=1882438 RepID=UPI0031AE451A
MIKKSNLKMGMYFPFLIVAILLNSCTTASKLKYFQDLPENNKVTDLGDSHFTEPVVQPDDILSINVNTTEADAGQIINARNGVNLVAGINSSTGSVGVSSGYLVDKDGFVEVPILGKVQLAGLTTTKAKEVVRTSAKKYFKDPIVDVRFSNFKITVLGEVNRPASYVLPNQQVTVLDAIGYAGDMTIYGKRNNVLIMRKTSDGKNQSITLDMTKKEVVNSPYYYLKQNDVVYVEPRRARQDTNTENSVLKYITVAATVLTAIVLLHRYSL